MQDVREKRSLGEEKQQATCGEAQGGVEVGEGPLGSPPGDSPSESSGRV